MYTHFRFSFSMTSSPIFGEYSSEPGLPYPTHCHSIGGEECQGEIPASRGLRLDGWGQMDQSKPNTLVALHFGGDEPRHRGLDRV